MYFSINLIELLRSIEKIHVVLVPLIMRNQILGISDSNIISPCAVISSIIFNTVY